jgi:hypothetical protein
VWRHIAHSVQGLAHVADGTPCQDSSRVLVLGEGDNETLVACVADGAGSAQHSAIGSTVACDSIMESIATHFHWRHSFADLQMKDVASWCEAARSKLGEIADSRDCQMWELATTLCVAIVSPSGSCFFQIGDGAIVLKRNGVCGVAFWPQSGEYVNTTTFLTSKVYRDALEFYSATNGFSDVALLTDGIERLALRFDVRIPHPPFFDPLFQALRAGNNSRDLGEDLRQFLQSESVQNRSDDDKTLILASRISVEIGGAD